MRRLFNQRTSSLPGLSDPSLYRARLTPQMLDYDDFASRAATNYLPYVMYFNQTNFKSETINTDRLGFRYSFTPEGEKISPASGPHMDPVNILVGSSAALGYGSTSDETSIASRLSTTYYPDHPWLNFSGHCYNSTQELMLYMLHQHLIPNVRRIVIMGGFNTLVMARLTEMHRGELGPYYFCADYFAQMEQVRIKNGGTRNTDPVDNSWPQRNSATPPLEISIQRAVDLVCRHLNTWRQIAQACGAELSFVLQPLATWVGDPCAKEKLLFDELDNISRLGSWSELYGDISTVEAGQAYSTELEQVCNYLTIPFHDMAKSLRENRTSDDWLYVDRAHFTDLGNDVIARRLADVTSQ